MRLLALLLFMFFPIASISACSHGGSTTIAASDYDQTCTKPTDCVVVADGNVCGCYQLGCGQAAINGREYERFKRDVSSLQDNCAKWTGSCPDGCIYSERTCIAGRCDVCHTQECAAATFADAGHD
jgi:hypothetical protein